MTLQGMVAQVPSLKATNYAIEMTHGMNRNELHEFAIQEFKSRSRAQILIEHPEHIEKDDKTLIFNIDPTLDYTYCVKHSADSLILTANNLENGKWLVYQFIEALSQEDPTISASDLPPAYINFNTHCDTFDFEYREPLFPTNLKEGNTQIYGTNSVDADWGIWGHNLSKITTPKPDIFAEIKQEKDQDQFCFTSQALYSQVSNFIMENYGYGEKKASRFVIMPEDNNLVCTCPACVEIGNTSSNATPAVSRFITKLATQFPNHLFFTSSYRTTKELPQSPLPDNTGVFLSTIDLPQGIGLTKNQPATKKFIEDIATWKKLTPHVYVWDYPANFDDYLSPVPVLYSLQKRLAFFKNEGIKGVFLNASGYDHSSFEDLKTYISGILMQKNEVDIYHFIGAYLKKFYPEHHQLLSDFYIRLEKRFSSKNTAFNIYGGMDENLGSYLDKKQFLKFYNDFEALTNFNPLPEKYKKLWIALNFTKLQIAYEEKSGTNGFVALENGKLNVKEEIGTLLENLKMYKKTDNLNHYREENGNLDVYISNWEYISENKNLENLLLNQPVETNLSKYQSQTSILTDGIPGFPSDYHLGWFISENTIEFKFDAPVDGKKTLQLRFLENERHRFNPPKKIQIQINGVFSEAKSKTEKSKNLVQIEFDIIMKKEAEIILFLTNEEKAKSKIAIDEIRIL